VACGHSSDVPRSTSHRSRTALIARWKEAVKYHGIERNTTSRLVLCVSALFFRAITCRNRLGCKKTNVRCAEAKRRTIGGDANYRPPSFSPRCAMRQSLFISIRVDSSVTSSEERSTKREGDTETANDDRPSRFHDATARKRVSPENRKLLRQA
jgi:hypothetical protein